MKIKKYLIVVAVPDADAENINKDTIFDNLRESSDFYDNCAIEIEEVKEFKEIKADKDSKMD